jgi:hypothetical protein
VHKVSVALFLAVLAVAPAANAIERQHHLGLAPDLAILKVQDKSTVSIGGGGTLHYAYGLTDQWNLAVEAGSAVVAADQVQDQPSSPRNRPGTVDHASVGVGYVIDILRWVPYLTAQGSLFRLAGGTLDDALFIPGVSVGLGLDYQLSRSWAVGIGGREHFLLSKLKEYPSYTTVLLRFEYLWGF